MSEPTKPGMIDTRFLKVHPATAVWFRQREECALCGASGSFSDGAMTCFSANDYCIDARLPEGACGPDAKLFTPKDSSNG